MRTKTHETMRQLRMKATRKKVEYRWHWSVRASTDGVDLVERTGWKLGTVVSDVADAIKVRAQVMADRKKRAS